MSVTVKANRHGHLAFQIRFGGWKKWLGTKLPDSPANARKLEKVATVIEYELERGKKLRQVVREHLGFSPAGDMPDEAPAAALAEIPSRIEAYAETWLKRQVPPLVTTATARNRKFLINKVVGKRWFGETEFADITTEALAEWRGDLLSRKLSIGYVRGAIDGHFRALFRDARLAAKAAARGLGVALPGWTLDNPFEELVWKDGLSAEPDPFTDEEKRKLLDYFREKKPGWYPLLLWQLEVGTRPSEAVALRVMDVDLDTGTAHIRRSRVGRKEGLATKTADSQRLTLIWPWVKEELVELGFPKSGDPGAFFFSTPRGMPVSQEYFSGVFWRPALEAAGVRRRRFYCTRHTAISAALSAGERTPWVAENFGTSALIIERHYAKWIGRHGGSALIAARGGASNFRQTSQGEAEKTEQPPHCEQSSHGNTPDEKSSKINPPAQVVGGDFEPNLGESRPGLTWFEKGEE
jgi:integrase